MAIPPVVIRFLAEGVPDIAKAIRGVSDIILQTESRSTAAARLGANDRVQEATREAQEKVAAWRRGDAMIAAAQRAGNREAENAAREQHRMAATVANEKIRQIQRVANEERRLRGEVLRAKVEKAGGKGFSATNPDVVDALVPSRAAGTSGELEVARFQRAQQKIDAIKDDARAREVAKDDSSARESLRRREAAERESAQRRQQFARAMVGAAGAGIKHVAAGASGLLQLGGGYSPLEAIQERMKAQGLAADIANSGFMPNGDVTANKAKRSSGDILGAATAAGTPYGYGQQETLEGLSAFVGKSGDLATGLKVLPQLAELARATGASLADMTSAAGDTMSQFQGVDDKGEAVMTVMRGIAGQGKLGAVEIKDLARQMAKLSAAAGQVEGDAVGNILKFGMLAQEAKGGGGAASATQAATAAQGIVNTLKTPARIKAFRAEGIEVFDKKSGMLRSPEKIIMQSLEKTKGDPEKMKVMFANIVGEKAVTAYANTYRKAQNGGIKNEKGETLTGKQAVQGMFDRMLSGAAMSTGDVTTAASSRMAEADMQFTRSVLELKEATASKLIPALTEIVPSLTKLIPVVGDVADSASRLASFLARLAASNPWGGVGAVLGLAIGAEVGKAGLALVLEKALATSFGSVAGVTLGAATIAIAAAVLTINAVTDADKKVTDDTVKSRLAGVNAGLDLNDATFRAQAGPADPKKVAEASQKIADAKSQLGDMDKQLKVAEANKGGMASKAATGAAWFHDLAAVVSGGEFGTDELVPEVEAAKKERVAQDEAAITKQREEMEALTKTIIAAEAALKQMTEAAGPPVDPNQSNVKTPMVKR